MSTPRVTAETLIIHAHPNADALELAQVGLYRAVVAKGAYRTGDIAFYIPEQAVLPPALIEELGLTGRPAGRAADRVKAVRLRGELSQGIVCRPRTLADVDLAAAVADALKEDPRNLYWRAIRAHGVPAVAARLAEKLGASRIGVFGEVYGAGVQDLPYGADGRGTTLGYAVFDVSAEIGGAGRVAVAGRAADR